ncbi:MAG TPA: hypothetical protein VN709_11790 [Terriglobales bacterium]|nr:hypothetical protein [Terriglobales bacterium]
MNEPASANGAVHQLAVERRSFIIGTLLVWAVIVSTVIILFASMEPQLFQAASTTGHVLTLQQVSDQMARLAPLTMQQQLLLDLVVLVGSVALFFLNYRFSFLIRRPRGAFPAPTGAARPGQVTTARWLWWMLLALNSMFYVTFLIPQLILTFLLARWGREEMRRAASRDSGPEDGAQVSS